MYERVLILFKLINTSKNRFIPLKHKIKTSGYITKNENYEVFQVQIPLFVC